MTLTKPVLLFIGMLVFFGNVSLVAQDDEKDFMKWLKQRRENEKKQSEEFKTFLSERDKAFSSFLKTRWEEFEAYGGMTLYKEKKPLVMPTIAPTVIGKPIPVVIPPVEIKPEKPAIIKPTAPPTQNETTLKITYFGQILELKLPASIKTLHLNAGMNERSFADNWLKMSSNIDPNLLKELRGLKTYLKLNDWAYAILIQQVAESIYSDNRSTMLTWFMLNKSGLKTKLGFHSNRAYILIRPKLSLYGMPYYKLGGKKEKFYPISDFTDPYKKSVSKIKTYSADYPDKQNAYDLNLTDLPNFKNTKPIRRNTNITFRQKKYTLTYTLNPNILALMDTIPQSKFDVYYTANMSQSAFATLINSLKKITRPMAETEKINFLLRFSQKFTEYKTDTDQFGKEVYMFPDQVLYYPASDCDDRVSIFSYLVRSLTPHKIIYLLYPNHIATAVALNGNIDGDSINFKKTRYYVSDPTYIGADIGMTMPAYKKTKPTVFSVN